MQFKRRPVGWRQVSALDVCPWFQVTETLADKKIVVLRASNKKYYEVLTLYECVV